MPGANSKARIPLKSSHEPSVQPSTEALLSQAQMRAGSLSTWIRDSYSGSKALWLVLWPHRMAEFYVHSSECGLTGIKCIS